jgi:hypothetical protein
MKSNTHIPIPDATIDYSYFFFKGYFMRDIDKYSDAGISRA